MNYQFRLNIDGNVLSVLDSWNRSFGHLTGTFNRFAGMAQSRAQAIASRFRGAFGSATQSVEELNQRLQRLQGRRDLMVDTRQIRSANREIEALQGRIDRLTNTGTQRGGGGGSGGGFAGLLRGALPAIGLAGMVAGAGQFAKSGMDREQVKMAFAQFLKTPEATEQVFAQMNKFADKTPYTNEDVYGAGRSLLAAGYDKTQIMPRMNTLGNVAAGAQTDFQDLVGIYGKSKQKGFADTSDIWQYTDRKIPILDALQKVTGKDNATLLKMAEKRQISMDLIDKAFESMGGAGKGGAYDGMLEKLSNSAGGKWSTFTGSMGNKIAEWAATQNSVLGKAFDFGTEFITKLGPVEDAIGKLFTAFSPLIDTLKTVFTLFGNVAGNGSAMDGIINVLTGTLNGLTIVVSGLTSPLGQFYLAGVAIFTLLGQLPAMITTITTAFATNPFTVWIVAIGALVVGLKWAYDNLEWFRSAVDRVGAFIANTFTQLGVILKALVMPTPGNITAALAAIGGAWEKSGAGRSGSSSGDRDAYENERDDRQLPFKPKSPVGLGVPAAPKAQSLGDKAGLSAATGGAKSTTINISLKSLVEKLEINALTADEGLTDLETKVTDILLRVINSASSVTVR